MSSPWDVSSQVLKDWSVDLFIVESLDFLAQQIALAHIHDCVFPGIEQKLLAPCCQKLSRSIQHLILVFFAELSSFQSQKSASTQVPKVRFLTDFCHIDLNALEIYSLGQALQAFGHKNILSVRTLPLPNHASSDHSFKKDALHFSLILRQNLLPTFLELLGSDCVISPEFKGTFNKPYKMLLFLLFHIDFVCSHL